MINHKVMNFCIILFVIYNIIIIVTCLDVRDNFEIRDVSEGEEVLLTCGFDLDDSNQENYRILWTYPKNSNESISQYGTKFEDKVCFSFIKISYATKNRDESAYSCKLSIKNDIFSEKYFLLRFREDNSYSNNFQSIGGNLNRYQILLLLTTIFLTVIIFIITSLYMVLRSVRQKKIGNSFE